MSEDHLYQRLSFPFNVDHGSLPDFSEGSSNIVPYIITDPVLWSLFSECHVYPMHSEIFVFAPKADICIHTDNYEINNMCKLNFMIGEGMVSWYSPLNTNIDKQISLTPIGSMYLEYSTDEVKKVLQKKVSGTFLMNTGVPHSFVNDSEHPCWIISIVLFNEATDKHLQFRDALEKFEQYRVEE